MRFFSCRFDLKNCNVNDRHLESVTSLDRVPDVVLVKKVFGDKARRNRWRKWKLKRMYKDDASSKTNLTYLLIHIFMYIFFLTQPQTNTPSSWRTSRRTRT